MSFLHSLSPVKYRNGETDFTAARRIADAIYLAASDGSLPSKTKAFADLVSSAKGHVEYQARGDVSQ